MSAGVVLGASGLAFAVVAGLLKRAGLFEVIGFAPPNIEGAVVVTVFTGSGFATPPRGVVAGAAVVGLVAGVVLKIFALTSVAGFGALNMLAVSALGAPNRLVVSLFGASSGLF